MKKAKCEKTMHELQNCTKFKKKKKPSLLIVFSRGFSRYLEGHNSLCTILRSRSKLLLQWFTIFFTDILINIPKLYITIVHDLLKEGSANICPGQIETSCFATHLCAAFFFFKNHSKIGGRGNPWAPL